ncbi:MAG: hypothetical protein Ct9H90mP24_3110 [Methanobacteriota archaeon]|nr:MAG: hypothetical protein Ct9H90mP24_3110 [Euryarchaeota archaeon]
MVVRRVSSLDIPTLRGNPFDSRPIERNRASEIVGRQEILIRWKEHMHSQSPRLILLSGGEGVGKDFTDQCHFVTDQRTLHRYVLA